MPKLTKIIVEKCTYCGANGKRDVRWDTEVRGLGLRIYPSGDKAFLISYRANGRKRLLVLGKVGVVSLDEARRDARIKLTSVLEGHDPLEEKNRMRAEKSMGQLVSEYIEKSKEHRKTWKTDMRRLEMFVLPRFKNLRASSILERDMASLHHRIGIESGKVSANRVIQLLRCIFEFGKHNEFLDRQALNPAKGVKLFKEKERNRWLNEEELIRVLSAIKNEPNVYARAAILLYLLLGVRKTELLRAKWCDINPHRKELKLIDTKNGADHYVPLSPSAQAVINKIPRQTGNPYIIVGAKPGAYLVNIRKPWLRIRKEANVNDVTVHDLRRSCGSMLAEAGHSLHLIGAVLNHKDSSSTQIYARISQSPVRAALDALGERITSIAGNENLLSISSIKSKPEAEEMKING